MPVSPRLEDFPLERALAFGRRLAEARKRVGYGSQTALARAAHLHPITVHKHEKQGQMPSRPVLWLYSRLLGVSEHYLIYGVDDPLLDLPEVVRDYLLGPHGQALPAEVFSRLTRISWDLLTENYIDLPMVHDVAMLVARNVAMRPQSGHDESRPEPGRRPVQLPLPRVEAPRRQALTA